MNVTLIPESAPFNTEQRAWLNGFLSGWLGMQAASGMRRRSTVPASKIGVALGQGVPMDGAPGASPRRAGHALARPGDRRSTTG